MAMKPYYDHAGITIYHGDCREILPQLPDKSVDLVLTDPPYGIGLSRNSRPRIAGDDNADAWDVVLLGLKIPKLVFASPKKPWSGEWRQYLVWDKGPAVGGGGDPGSFWKFDWELIQSNHASFYGKRDSSVLRFWVGPTDSPHHPAEKPLALLRYMIHKTTLEEQTILDPFMGSGTTLVAAKQLGRKAIGIEVEEKYCEIAVKRLQQEMLPLAPASPIVEENLKLYPDS